MNVDRYYDNGVETVHLVINETLDVSDYVQKEWKALIDKEVYDGTYEITPTPECQTLNTASKVMLDDVKILGVPYFETSNESGTTVYIADTTNEG